MDKRVDVFEGTDHTASVKLKGCTLTISFTFDDATTANLVGMRLVEAHRTGDVVAFELSNPVYPQ